MQCMYLKHYLPACFFHRVLPHRGIRGTYRILNCTRRRILFSATLFKWCVGLLTMHVHKRALTNAYAYIILTHLFIPQVFRCVAFEENCFEVSEILPSMQVTANLQVCCEALRACLWLQVSVIFTSIAYSI